MPLLYHFDLHTGLVIARAFIGILATRRLGLLLCLKVIPWFISLVVLLGIQWELSEGGKIPECLRSDLLCLRSSLFKCTYPILD